MTLIDATRSVNIGVARIFAAELHSNVASNGDDPF